MYVHVCMNTYISSIDQCSLVQVNVHSISRRTDLKALNLQWQTIHIPTQAYIVHLWLLSTIDSHDIFHSACLPYKHLSVVLDCTA